MSIAKKQETKSKQKAKPKQKFETRVYMVNLDDCEEDILAELKDWRH